MINLLSCNSSTQRTSINSVVQLDGYSWSVSHLDPILEEKLCSMHTVSSQIDYLHLIVKILALVRGWLGEAMVLCIVRHLGVQLILAYSWARPAILAAGKGRRGMFLLSPCFLKIHFVQT